MEVSLYLSCVCVKHHKAVEETLINARPIVVGIDVSERQKQC